MCVVFNGQATVSADASADASADENFLDDAQRKLIDDTEEELIEAFEICDRDDNNFIVVELRRVMINLVAKDPNAGVDKLIRDEEATKPRGSFSHTKTCEW